VVFIDLWSGPEYDIDNARIQAGVNFVEAAAGIDGKGMRGHVLEGVHATHTEFAAIPPFRTAPIVLLNGASSSHGTNTAGEIYARGVNAPYRGILPFAQMIYTNYSSIINTNGRYALTRDLVDPAQIYKATFQTASWGDARTTQYTTRSAEMDDITFDFARLFVTNSQSNAGATSIPQNSRPQAWAKNVVSVGGFRHNNNIDPNDDCWCSTGSTGPAADGRIGVTFAAYYDNIGTTSGSASYTNTFGGTSGATPIINGLGGATIQMFTDGLFGYPGVAWQDRFDAAPNTTTTRVLMSLASRQLPLSRATRPQQGWGLPNLQDLYENRDRLLILDEEDVLRSGESRTYVVFVKPGTPEFRASMHHLEDEAVPFANPTRINSLDLKVTAPDGTVYWGNNGLSAALTSSPGGVPNDIDVHENVILTNPTPGAWQVTVDAAVIRADSHRETAAIDADFALGVLGIGGGRDRSGAVLDLASPAPGRLDVTVSGQASGWVGGFTLLSLDTRRHASLGNVFGIEADAVTQAVLSVPVGAGNVFAFSATSEQALYPNAPFRFPAEVAAALQGRTLDAVVVFYAANGDIVDVSNVARVTVQ
jgi:serine protease AprX